MATSAAAVLRQELAAQQQHTTQLVSLVREELEHADAQLCEEQRQHEQTKQLLARLHGQQHALAERLRVREGASICLPLFCLFAPPRQQCTAHLSCVPTSLHRTRWRCLQPNSRA